MPPMRGTPVPFLVGKLRSHMPSGEPPAKEEKKIALEQNRQRLELIRNVGPMWI